MLQVRNFGVRICFTRDGNKNNLNLDIKRLMGKTSFDAFIEECQPYWTFKVVIEQLNLLIEVMHNRKTFHVTPEEISAKILEKMKQTAQRVTDLPITQAVITVPAYFNQAQKEATLTAAKLAQLEVIQLITEPAAAAFAYGVDQRGYNNYNILVFDLGGGTFDVVVMRVENNEFTVKAIGGDTRIGGRDFDHKIFDFLCEEIRNRYNKNCRANKGLHRKLLTQCENIKQTLTWTTTTR